MKRPLIGLTTDRELSSRQTRLHTINEDYVQAVLRAGGAPLLIPTGFPTGDLPDLAEKLDGFILIGGGDVEISRFNGRPHPRIGGVEPDRDELEISLVKMLAANDKPFLGICRGVQVINVAFGGSLYTDIAAQKENAIRHDYYPNFPRNYGAHKVSVTADSRLAAIIQGTELEVNSLHHQGIERLAPGLVIAATAPDGLIEAVELPASRFGMGVQWHPECLKESPANQAIFTTFIQAAAE
jgi:putative glutamine amidotransferase